MIVLYSPLCIAASEDIRSSLKHQGTLFRLQGDYEGADRVRDQLRSLFPNDAIGHVFNLNTLVTRISWNPDQTIFDAELLTDAQRALQICTKNIAKRPQDFLAYYYCGQTHFALTYLHSIRGNYYQAGTNSTVTIKRLEQALALEPQLVDAKMHLGIAYHYVDNLPSFIKALSPFLWFIPTGNSERSLPYLEEVSLHGQYFRDVAKFLYSDLLIAGDREDKEKALSLLRQLVRDYPQNGRFQLSSIWVLMDIERYEESILAVNSFLAIAKQHNLSELDSNLAKLWATRAYLETGNTDAAQRLFKNAEYYFERTSEMIPQRISSWRLLTQAQLFDLHNLRQEAIRAYRLILDMRRTGFVNEKVIADAQAGLKAPYR